MPLTSDERLSLLEYKVLALSLHVQRIESTLSNIVGTSNAPSFAEMRARLSEIDGLGAALPLETMTTAKAREMLGSGPSPRRHNTIADLVNLALPE